MMQRPTILLLIPSFLATATAFRNPYPYTHTNCGIEQTIIDTPQKVITMNQGATEFMLAMGLQNNIAGTRAVSDVDPIWPRYKEAYASIPKIPKPPDTSGSYPTDEQMINQYKADFIFASWRSAFREYEPPRQNAEDTDKSKGVWSDKTGIGPCDGESSDWWTAAGVNSTYNETNLHGYSTCRSQLHAKGINTWLEPVSCEDPELRKPGTPETVYKAITTLGNIFNVPTVANKLIDDMKNDFKLAEETLKKSAGYSLTAVWLDCVTCCANKTVYPGEWAFVGSGGGAPQLIMQESGLTNVFADRENSWACVKLEEIVASDPDVMIVVDASFDPAMGKIDFMHNHSLFCNTRFVRNADYIRVPFSASTLGPRNGAAALDIVAAALHVIAGSMELTAQSGVDFFDPEMLATRTANLACPVDPSKVKYMKTSYTNCGVRHTLTKTPERVVTIHQGATEFMLAMGLEDKMVGTATMDDTIWPRYAEAYNQIPILSKGEPTEKQIMDVSADFIVGAYSSAFAEFRGTNCLFDSCKGIFSNATVGPCDGVNSDYFPAGSGDPKVVPYSTCRPQLHAAGIGTWLWEDYCEDPALRPASGATEDTVYAAVEQLGHIFNVPHVASKLVADIRNDFKVAEDALKASGVPSLKAVWLDCIEGCCNAARPGWDPSKTIFVGGGHGAPNIIMEESGLKNAFADREGSWYCVSLQDIIDAEPDVFVIVDASWDSAEGKIDYLHNHTDYCNLKAVQNADYIKIQFSASTLGPRNGVAALDMVSAAMHVVTGDQTLNFQSGVDFFEEEMLKSRTENLKCPYVPKAEKILYKIEFEDRDKIPGWAIALIVIACLLCVLFSAFAFGMYFREKQGKPMFMTLEASKAAQQAQQAAAPGVIEGQEVQEKEIQLSQA